MRSFFSRPPFRGDAPPSLALLIAITMMGTVAMHIFVPAMPAAAADLHASAALIQSTITLYIAGLAIGQLIYGPLSDRYGRRPIIIVSLSLYVVGLVLALPVATVHGLIAARLLQSLGACGSLVIGRAMVRDSARGDDVIRRLAVLTIAMTVTPAIAPAIGGFISLWLGWRAIFLVLAAIMATLLALVGLTLPETSQTRLAMPGVRSLIATYGRLLMLPDFRNFLIAGTCCTTSIYAFLAAAPFLFIDMLHRSAGDVGIYCMIVIAGMIVGAAGARQLAGRIALRTGARWGSWCCLAGAAGLLVADLAHQLSVATVIAPMVLYSVGVGMTSPNAVTGLMNAAPRAVGTASSLYGFMQMSFGAFVTLVVELWNDGSALPVAVTLLLSSAAAQLALRRL